MKISDRIKYVYMDIPREMMPYYYSISDFIAVPSITEGFGLPLVEAIATNIPFVSLNTGIAPKLEKYGFGYIANSDEDFKKKCHKMIENPVNFQNGKKFVENNFSWKKYARDVINIYKTIIN